MERIDRRSCTDVERAADGPILDGLLGQVGHGGRTMVRKATQGLVKRFGDRGSCILIDDRARVVLSTAVPELTELRLDLARYPEIGVALASREVVVIEDVQRSALLHPVADLLPDHLGAVVVIPLVFGDRCLGVIMTQSERPRKMGRHDVAAARFEGRLAATLLDLQFGRELDHELRLPAPSDVGASHGAVPGWTAIAGPQAAVIPGVVRRRILIAEDDLDHAATLDSFLTDEGFEVTLTRNGAEVLRQAHDLPPDLILLDAQMPVLNGFDAAEKLVADIRTCGVPILILSGAEDLVPRVRGLKLDTVDFLRKPYSPLELLARIERSLNQGRTRELLRREASIDELTGLGNARSLRQSLNLEQSRISRYGTMSAIVMMDVDKLKTINDRHGHLVGTQVLHAIGESLRTTIRDTDLAARYGGDEFVVILPHTTAVEGGAFAERFLSRVRELRPGGVQVSMSMGVAALGGAETASVDVLLARADAAAYRAKHQGGNCACIYDSALDLVAPATGPRLD
jgi:two-component system cell cycle response regulator